MEVLDLPVRKRRYPTYLARLDSGAVCIKGLVRNVTAGGAMFEGAYPLRVGARFELEISGLGQFSATVVWSLESRAGVILIPNAHFAEVHDEPAHGGRAKDSNESVATVSRLTAAARRVDKTDILAG